MLIAVECCGNTSSQSVKNIHGFEWWPGVVQKWPKNTTKYVREVQLFHYMMSCDSFVMNKLNSNHHLSTFVCFWSFTNFDHYLENSSMNILINYKVNWVSIAIESSWLWVNDDRVFIYGWTIPPLDALNVSGLWSPFQRITCLWSSSYRVFWKEWMYIVRVPVLLHMSGHHY